MTDVTPCFKPVRKGTTESKAKQIVRERAAGRCEVRWEGVCLGTVHVVHHVELRLGKLHDPELMAAACNPCHIAIHHHVAEAKARGWLISHDDRTTEGETR